jgi:hypothetical protein
LGGDTREMFDARVEARKLGQVVECLVPIVADEGV